MTTITISKKEYQALKIIYPRTDMKDYKKTWQRLELLGEEIEKIWKNRKTALELLKESKR